jgi:glycosyltransferase involved in cell wall biosynthesis
MIAAFALMPEKRLVVVGDGPEFNNLKSGAPPNITFTGYLSAQALNSYLSKAKAFVFAADEDFGIAPVEALGCGIPVIALNKGGTAETIKDGVYGVLFDKQDPNSIKEAVIRFEGKASGFDPDVLRNYAGQFRRSIFEEKIKNFVDSKLAEFYKS